MSRRIVFGALLGLVLVGVMGIGGLPFLARGLPPVRSVPDRGSATALIGGPVGFELTVGDVHLPPAAGGRAAMALTFRNTSTAQQRADPMDFTLRDGAGTRVAPTFDAACPRWTRADLHPAAGQSEPPRDRDGSQVGAIFGPIPLCFAVAHTVPGGLTLIWWPDVGLLASPIEIPLR